MNTEQHRYFYNTVLSQTISSSGKNLFAGNRFGDIFVINLQALNADPPQEIKPKIVSQGEKTPILSLCFHGNFLIVGTTGIIYGLRWDPVMDELLSAKQWKIKIPLMDDAYEATDVNYMWLNQATEMLYAGCSDNNVYQISLSEDGRIVRSFQGHTNFIHSVTGTPDNGRLYTASEDGTVRIWDQKVKDSIQQIEPSLKDSLARTNLGKWIGDVSVNNDWLLCGGGPELSLWNIKTMDCMQIFNYPGPVHVCDFIESDLVIAVGEYKSVKIFEMTSKVLAEVPIENTASYSVVWQNEPIKCMSIAGYSNKLHLMKDFRYIETKVDLYPSPFSDDEISEEESSSEESELSDNDDIDEYNGVEQNGMTKD